MSEATAKAGAFVTAHLEEASALGRRLADLTEEPDAYLATLTEGLVSLTEPAYLELVTRACPETPARYLVRGALSEAMAKPIKAALREGSSMSALQLAHRTLRGRPPRPAPPCP